MEEDQANGKGSIHCHATLQQAELKCLYSKIALSLGESLKYSGPEVKEAIRSGVRPTLIKPVKLELKMVDNVK